jgi:hypothetical protein
MSTTEAERYALDAKSILDNADIEGRELTPEERGEVETLLAKAREARDLGKQMDTSKATARR